MKKLYLLILLVCLAFFTFGQTDATFLVQKTQLKSGESQLFTQPVVRSSVIDLGNQIIYNFSGKIDTFTVPSNVNKIIITAIGASGGVDMDSYFPGGLGALVSGEFDVIPGDKLKLIVGENPVRNGGGGGSFVSDLLNNPLIIAGGGGGSGNLDSPEKHGSITETGGKGGGTGGDGGIDGNGGLANGTGYQSGAGGGLLSNGANGNSPMIGGIAFVNGGNHLNIGYGDGGFGGGGTGSGYVVGGGGGGYSGGGAAGNGTGGGVGGGGASFNSGSNKNFIAQHNIGHGQIIIELIKSNSCPGNISVDNDPGLCSAVVNFTVNAPEKGSVVQTGGLPGGTEFPVGTVVNTFLLTDSLGVETTCNFTVTVNDTEAPIIDCPKNIVVSNDPGECGAIVTFSTLSDEVLIDEVLPGSISGWEVYDYPNNPTFFYEEVISPYDGTTAIKTRAVGNTYSWCSTESITKIYEISGNTSTTSLQAYLEFYSNLTTYNFPYITVEIKDSNDGILGYHIYYGKDMVGSWYLNNYINGNPAYYTELPSATGEMILDLSKIGEDIDFDKFSIRISNYTCIGENTIILDHLRVLNGSVNNGTENNGPVASDNCSGVKVDASIPSGSVFPVGTSPVTLTATDAAGNITSCTFNITVEDTEAPVAVCGNNGTVKNVLLLWDTDNANTQSLKTAIEAAGFTVTLPDVPEYQWDGTNPALDEFDAVIHLNGTTYSSGLPLSAQNALLDFVQVQGKLFVHSEWDAYELDEFSTHPALEPIVILQRNSGYQTSITYSTVSGYETHPVLEGIPSQFTIDYAGHNVGQVRQYDTYPAETLILDQDGNAAVAVRELEHGRVVGFGLAGNYANSSSLSNEDVQKLFINALKWGTNISGDFEFIVDQTGTISITPEDIDLGSTDNCEIASMELSQTEFTWDDIGSQQVILSVTDIHGNSSTCTATVSIKGIGNLPPVIESADELYVWAGDSVTLDASETWDPNGDRIDFIWSHYYSKFLGEVTLLKTNDPKVSFIAPEVEVLTLMPIRLRVSDGIENSVLIVNVYIRAKLNNAPLAHAGDDLEVNERNEGLLDGTASSDTDGNPITYIWSSDFLILNDTSSQTPVFIAPEVKTDTTVWITLVVNDGKLNSKPDSVQVTIKQVNRMPVAVASDDLIVNEGEQIEFDGYGSFDPDGDILTYIWSAESLIITDPNQVVANIIAPKVEENTTFPLVLVVTDGEMYSAPDTIYISIRQVNELPVWTEVPADTAFVGKEFSATIKVSDTDKLDVVSIFSDELPEWMIIDDHGDGTATIFIDSVPRVESLLGTHTFILKASDGTATIDTLMKLTVTINTGVADWQLSGLRVYPNPTSGIVHLDFSRLPAVGSLLQVYNQLGQTIAIQQINKQNSVLDLSAHPAGMYLIKVNSDGASQTKKIILR